MKILYKLGIAIALASATSLVALPQSAMAQKEKKKKKKKGKEADQNATPPLELSPAYLDAYRTNNDLLNAGNTDLVKINLPDIAPLIANESDGYVHGNLTFNLGQKLKDSTLQVEGIEKMLQHEQFLPAQNKPIFLFLLGSVAFDNKDHQKSTTRLNEAYNAGYRSNNIELLLGIAYNRLNNPTTAIEWYERYVEASKNGRGSADVKSIYGNMAVAAIGSGDPALIDSTFKKILPSTTDSALWHDALAQLIKNSNYTQQENLDILRLMDANNAMLFVHEYGEYVEAADARRLPNEVVAIINSGIAKGHIPKNDITFKEFIQTAEARLAADRADLPAAEKDARQSTSGRSARATADAYLSYGEYQSAIDLYKLAIDKGDIDVDRALNRMGIAQLKLGDFESAKASFAAITSPNRRNIGDYWTIYANNLQNQQQP